MICPRCPRWSGAYLRTWNDLTTVFVPPILLSLDAEEAVAAGS